MLQVLIGLLLITSFLFALFTNQGDRVFSMFLSGGQESVELVMEMAGTFGIFCGLMNVLSQAGGMEWLNRRLRRPLHFLLGEVNAQALSYATVNLAANMLGLGNAATPAGIKAAKALADGPRATPALCMFLVINASSVQLIPSTVIALRAAHGAAHPEAVVVPGLLSTALSTAAGILLCKWMERMKR